MTNVIQVNVTAMPSASILREVSIVNVQKVKYFFVTHWQIENVSFCSVSGKNRKILMLLSFYIFQLLHSIALLLLFNDSECLKVPISDGN